ncbi:MAG: hypothetical protein M1828_005150 [Chrysothrix sp. TS-e1954]|nr:MAG: hypothetical protein M1828_005150 [Chrysothrix sp. TS-e1954]
MPSERKPKIKKFHPGPKSKLDQSTPQLPGPGAASNGNAQSGLVDSELSKMSPNGHALSNTENTVSHSKAAKFKPKKGSEILESPDNGNSHENAAIKVANHNLDGPSDDSGNVKATKEGDQNLSKAAKNAKSKLSSKEEDQHPSKAASSVKFKLSSKDYDQAEEDDQVSSNATDETDDDEAEIGPGERRKKKKVGLKGHRVSSKANLDLFKLSGMKRTKLGGNLASNEEDAEPGKVNKPVFEFDSMEDPFARKNEDAEPVKVKEPVFKLGMMEDSSDDSDGGPKSPAGRKLAEAREKRRDERYDMAKKWEFASRKRVGKYHPMYELDGANDEVSDDDEPIYGLDGANDEVSDDDEPMYGLDGTHDDHPKVNGSTSNPVTGPSKSVPKLANVDHAALQEKLAARLAAMRAARKADGPNGRPAKNRSELLEHRRQKHTAKMAAQKEKRTKEETDRTAADEARRLYGGRDGSLMSLSEAIDTDRTKLAARAAAAASVPINLSFGRVAFDDGTTVSSLNGKNASHQSRGPRDPNAALAVSQARANRLSGMDASKKTAAEEADRWAGAAKRVAGEKVKDDLSLLKRSVKQKEAKKTKGRKEWAARAATVQKGRAEKQKRRQRNLAGRKNRPGFEGKKGL